MVRAVVLVHASGLWGPRAGIRVRKTCVQVLALLCPVLTPPSLSVPFCKRKGQRLPFAVAVRTTRDPLTTWGVPFPTILPLKVFLYLALTVYQGTGWCCLLSGKEADICPLSQAGMSMWVQDES